MTIHEFGAFFGLAATWFFQKNKAIKDERQQNGGSYYSNYIAMIGTLFLFIYWPSFNAAVGSGSQQVRAAINTLMSITTSVISACWISRLTMGNKLDMEIVLNATLAGGVVMGASADLIDKPYHSMIAGFVIGAVSALGYAYSNAFLKEKIGLHDTCGVFYLHGIPGLVGGFLSAICSS